MKTQLLLLFFLFSYCGLVGQTFQDNFSDGDFTQNPSWQGNSAVFTVNNGNELQLNDVVAATSFLSTAVGIQDSTTWEFYTRLEFSPSDNNYARVYLSSDATDLTSSLNGYYIRLGKSGSDDAVELYKQTGSSSSLLISATAGAIATGANLRVRVVRDNASNWSLYVDYSGGTNYVLEGTATDNSFQNGSYLGVYCKYTLSNVNKFFFDDFFVSPLFEDNLAPNILELTTISATQLDVLFDEPILPSSANQTQNFDVNNGIGNPSTASLDADGRTVHLNFASSFVNGGSYELTAENIEDLNENIQLTQSKSFIYSIPEIGEAYDIIINEIYADFSPSIGLPEAEFVELYNRSEKTIDLANFVFQDATSSVNLPSYMLMPDSYVILCSNANSSLFSGFGTVLGVSSLPSLNNSGDSLKLLSSQAVLIDEVNYDISWYRDILKDDGGYTLERINPNLYCSEGENWRASFDALGGTPGKRNANYSTAVDLDPPVIVQSIALDQNTLLLVFNEKLDLTSALNVANYSGLDIASVLDVNAKTVQLNLSTALLSGQSYTLTFSNIEDCYGNSIINTNVQIIYYETEIAAAYDILINEIYADPSPSLGLPELEYVELYNRSNKYINLENMIFEDDASTIVLPYFILAPNSYVVLFEESGNIDFSSYGPNLALPNFVSIENSGDELVLSNQNGEQVNAVAFSSRWYGNSGKDDGGYSLELISKYNICQSSGNWMASEALIGGTPGQPNSVLNNDIVDESAPQLIAGFAENSTSVLLDFNESLTADAQNTSIYTFDDANIEVINASLVSPLNKQVIITLSTALQLGNIYTLTVNQQLKDCLGNPIGLSNSIQIALTDNMEKGDVIINELLFNPSSNGSDFIEIINLSDKVLNAADLIIATVDENAQIVFPAPVETNFTLFPKQYLVFTESPDAVRSQYVCQNPNNFVETDLPSFADKSGDVVLLTQGIVIDSFHYEEDYHHALIDDVNGVSLERINPFAPTGSLDNWHSAASTVGYATPTYLNSQYFESQNPVEESFIIDNEVFSPNNDGYKDFLLLKYSLEEIGLMANISIFDSKGRLVKNLVENQLLAKEDFFQWDGTNNDNSKARIGIYIIYIELFDLNGNIKKYKKSCVIGASL